MLRLFARIFLTFVWVSAANTSASDLDRERRMASEIVDAIIDGEPVYLASGDHKFLNIYTGSEAGQSKGAVIILHGRGYHPDWVDVIQPLRVGLAEEGWNTLSMQMPVLDKKAKYYAYVPILSEAFPRIEAGIDYLKSQGNRRIVLVAHSCSVHMTMAWVRSGRLRDIDAYVGIGMGATDYQQPMKRPFPLDSILMPVLDVYGQDEYPAVLKTAPRRLEMIRNAGNGKSKQVVVPGADHYFKDRGNELLDVVSAWLDSI